MQNILFPFKTLLKSLCSIIFIFVLLGMPSVAKAQNLPFWTGKVVEIKSSDTLVIEVDGKDGEKKEVRLYGLKVPDDDKPFGNKAKDALRSRGLGKTVDVEEKSTENGHIFGIVSLPQEGNVALNLILLKGGLARYVIRGCKETFCQEWQMQERAAKKAKLNLWSLRYDL